jgi:hypothetical protein
MASLLVDLGTPLPYSSLSAVCTPSSYTAKIQKENTSIMKTKKGFRLRNICGENIIVAEGVENIDFSRIISMNESSAYLWKKVEGQDFTEKDLTDYLTEEYDVDEETAQKDVTTLIAKWLDAGIISK